MSSPAYQRAQALLELLGLPGAPPGAAPAPAPADLLGVPAAGGGQFNVNLPNVRPPDFGGADALDLYASLQKAGADKPEDIIKAVSDTLAQRAMQQNLPLLSPGAQQIDAIQKHPVAPVSEAGGVFFNRYNTTSPLIATTPVGTAQMGADQARAGASEAAGRASDASARLRDTERRNAGALPPNGRIKAKRPDGTVGWFDAVPGVNGQVVYKPSLGPDGQPLAADSTADNATSEEQNIKNRARILGIDEKAALETLMQRVDPSEREAIRQLGMQLLRDPYAGAKYAKDPALLEKAVQDQLATFDRIAAARAGVSLPAAPAAVAPAQPAGDNPLYAEARDAIARGANKDAVNARLKQKGLAPLP